MDSPVHRAVLFTKTYIESEGWLLLTHATLPSCTASPEVNDLKVQAYQTRRLVRTLS